MHTVAIAGASGVVGARALSHLLDRFDVERVIAVGRRPLALAHARLTSTVVERLHPEELEAALPAGLSAALCALGTTMRKAGSRDAFRAVDHDAVIAFARAARTRGARRFALISSIGADARSSNFYLRTKGEAEQVLTTLGFEKLLVLRPSFIDDEGARTESRPLERLGLPIARALAGLFGRTRRWAPVSADVIGGVAVRLLLADGAPGVRFVESDELHALAS